MRAEAAAIGEQRQALERSLAQRQASIGRMLAARHASGAPDALRVALSGNDPAAASRTLHYVSYVTRVAAAMLAEYRAGVAQAEALARLSARVKESFDPRRILNRGRMYEGV